MLQEKDDAQHTTPASVRLHATTEEDVTKRTLRTRRRETKQIIKCPPGEERRERD